MPLRSRLVTRPALQLSAVALVLALSAVCGDSPTAPGGGGPARVLSGVELTGPQSIAPGESAQFSLDVLYSDGSRGAPSTPVTWRSSNPSVLSTDANGFVTAGQRGRATITAQLGNRNAAREIFVLPAGTYWLNGVVTETGAPSFYLSGTKVTVIGGTGAGTTLVTGFDGRYELFGVAGHVRLSLEKDGYLPRTLEVDVSSHQKIDVDLTLKEARPTFSGNYTMTVSAAAECRSNLPEPARERRYSTTLRQEGPQLIVTIGGANFVTHYGQVQNGFRGVVMPDVITVRTFFWDSYYYGYPSILEVMGTDAYYSPTGTITLTGSAAELRGTLDGTVAVYRDVNGVTPVGSCRSANHQIVLTR